MDNTESTRILSIDKVANGYVVNLMQISKEPIEVGRSGGLADMLFSHKRHPVEHHVCMTWSDVIRVVSLADPQASNTLSKMLEKKEEDTEP